MKKDHDNEQEEADAGGRILQRGFRRSTVIAASLALLCCGMALFWIAWPGEALEFPGDIGKLLHGGVVFLSGIGLLALLVHRMHVHGYSGWWLALPIACIGVHEYLSLLEERASEAQEPSSLLVIFSFVWGLFTFVFCLYILIELCKPAPHK